MLTCSPAVESDQARLKLRHVNIAITHDCGRMAYLLLSPYAVTRSGDLPVVVGFLAMAGLGIWLAVSIMRGS